MKYLVTIIYFSSLIYTESLSRIVTTIDPPSAYDLITQNLESNQVLNQSFKNKSSLNIAYEHLSFKYEKFNLYAGGEFMIGRKSQSRVAFHSIYLMPSYEIKDKLSLTGRLGISQINTDQDNFPLDFGFITSLGLEYQISSNMALSLVYSMYDMKNKRVNGSSGYSTPLIFGDIGDNDLELDLKYNKVGISVIYGFEIADKKEKNEKN